jgi:hypothetical protein
MQAACIEADFSSSDDWGHMYDGDTTLPPLH